MSHYRVFMSARLATTGEIVAIVTLLRKVLNSYIAESYVEAYTRNGNTVTSDLKQVIHRLWGDEVLFVYMKELVE